MPSHRSTYCKSGSVFPGYRNLLFSMDSRFRGNDRFMGR
jgi:hypothetical protein